MTRSSTLTRYPGVSVIFGWQLPLVYGVCSRDPLPSESLPLLKVADAAQKNNPLSSRRSRLAGQQQCSARSPRIRCYSRAPVVAKRYESRGKRRELGESEKNGGGGHTWLWRYYIQYKSTSPSPHKTPGSLFSCLREETATIEPSLSDTTFLANP